MEGHVELLQWYGPRRRAYPWREERPDPYRVLVSEVMLQQTQAARVAPAYGVFLSRFPTIRSLAEAGGDEVLEVWSGLGYNRRAIGLWRAAREVVRRWDGRIPSDRSELVGLAGVGPYTAGAVASIAYGVAAPALDVNASRVVARARLGVDQHEAGSIEIHRAAEDWLDRDGPGDWNQAVMDLGREVCRPVPRCGVCPLRQACRIRRAGRPLASGPRPARAPFQGSLRQVRGAVIRALLREGPSSLGKLAGRIEQPLDRTTTAVRAMAREGLVRAGPAALAGRHRGMVRLPPRKGGGD